MARDFSYMHFKKGEEKITICLEKKIHKTGFAGFVGSPRFQENILLCVADERLAKLNIRGGYITTKEDGSDPRVFLDSNTFDNIKRGDIAARFMLFHEMGHYCCGHLASPPDVQEESKRRKALISQGKVSEEEVEADRFAAEYLGPETVMEALQEAQENRFAFDLYNGTQNEECSILAVREFRLRMDAIATYFGIADEYEDEEEN